jgi:hypothetical protein
LVGVAVGVAVGEFVGVLVGELVGLLVGALVPNTQLLPLGAFIQRPEQTQW